MTAKEKISQCMICFGITLVLAMLVSAPSYVIFMVLSDIANGK